MAIGHSKTIDNIILDSNIQAVGFSWVVYWCNYVPVLIRLYSNPNYLSLWLPRLLYGQSFHHISGICFIQPNSLPISIFNRVVVIGKSGRPKVVSSLFILSSCKINPTVKSCSSITNHIISHVKLLVCPFQGFYFFIQLPWYITNPCNRCTWSPSVTKIESVSIEGICIKINNLPSITPIYYRETHTWSHIKIISTTTIWN